MLIKSDVSIRELSHPAREALSAAHRVLREEDQELVLTSTTGGEHMGGSKHYVGNAVDITGRGACRKVWAEKIAALLGQDYDVVFERDHIHIEYDPDKK